MEEKTKKEDALEEQSFKRQRGRIPLFVEVDMVRFFVVYEKTCFSDVHMGLVIIKSM